LNNIFKLLLSFFFAVISLAGATAQELFVATEPASNMPKNSIKLRLSNEGVAETDLKSRTSFGVMYGLS
jgi:hypothetical protein